MTKLEAIERIRKLRALTARAGSTENEVSIAGQLVADMMKRYAITEAEIAGPADNGGRWADDEFFSRRGGSEPDKLGDLFAEFIRQTMGAFGAQPGGQGTTFYVGSARVTTGAGGVDDVLGLFEHFFGHAPSSAPLAGRAKNATPAAIRDHSKHPNRVHLAVNDMRSICGIGPTFVFTTDRAVAIRSGEPCPHCMETGVIDARQPQLKLPPNKLRDAKGRWV